MNDGDPRLSTAFAAAVGAEVIVVIAIIGAIALSSHRILPALNALCGWWE